MVGACFAGEILASIPRTTKKEAEEGKEKWKKKKGWRKKRRKKFPWLPKP